MKQNSSPNVNKKTILFVPKMYIWSGTTYLRNDIAHFNFSIIEGRLIIRGKLVVIRNKVLELLHFVTELIRVFDEEQKSRHK
jgi:hypothetical protein